MATQTSNVWWLDLVSNLPLLRRFKNSAVGVCDIANRTMRRWDKVEEKMLKHGKMVFC